MDYFIVENGKIRYQTKEEFESLKGIDVNDYTQGMSSEELKAFQKERYEKFIKPLIEYNISQFNQ
jgi:hypothetical protein